MGPPTAMALFTGQCCRPGRTGLGKAGTFSDRRCTDDGRGGKRYCCISSGSVAYRSGELILTHFSGEPLAAHTIDHRLTMVDLFCCTGTIAGQVPAAGSEVLSRVNASGREVLTRVLVAGKRSPSPGMAPG